MIRWLVWFLLVPQLFLLAGWLRAAGAPPLDLTVALALHCGLFAPPRALPGLVLGIAMARVVVDGAAGLAVQVLVVGLPVALLLPLRALLFGQRWLWQWLGTALLALGIPRLDGLFSALFAGVGQGPPVAGMQVVWSVLLLPPTLWLLRRLPPLRWFQEAVP